MLLEQIPPGDETIRPLSINDKWIRVLEYMGLNHTISNPVISSFILTYNPSVSQHCCGALPIAGCDNVVELRI